MTPYDWSTIGSKGRCGNIINILSWPTLHSCMMTIHDDDIEMQRQDAANKEELNSQTWQFGNEGRKTPRREALKNWRCLQNDLNPPKKMGQQWHLVGKQVNLSAAAAATPTFDKSPAFSFLIDNHNGKCWQCWKYQIQSLRNLENSRCCENASSMLILRCRDRPLSKEI